MTSQEARSLPLPSPKGAGAFLIAIGLAFGLSACSTKDAPATTTPAPAPTVGSLNVNVTPANAAVVVTGPSSSRSTFTGNKLLTELAPGQYTVSATAAAFTPGTADINVVAGQTSSISLILQATPIIVNGPRAVYRDGDGNLVAIDPTTFSSGKFYFYAWLEDRATGISPATLILTTGGDPGKPLLTEQTETAPSFTQNLAGAWVGVMDPSGVIRPVIGADVRWEIDQWYAGRVNSMQFGTSDDNRVALGLGVFDDQADTRTNNSHLDSERYPLVAAEYPLYNATGIASPFVDGFTWVTLFSPDREAVGRIVAVATINGEEIGKQILYKSFAPIPRLEITKTVNTDVVNLVNGTASVTWTVRVRNVGSGDATTVDLRDILASGAGASYTLGSLPTGSTAVGDGFTLIFPLPSSSTPVPPQNSQLLGDAYSFAVLANATVTNTGSSVVSGNVGASAGTSITGFPPGTVLNGTVHIADAAALAAQNALSAAYVNLAARPCTAALNSPLSGTTLTPGVYCFDSSAALTGALVLDAQGNPGAEFVFKIGTALTTASGATISLINGASACNVYWQIGSSATLGTSTFFSGNLLAQASVTVGTGATLAGRAMARTGSVTLDTNAVNAPQSCVGGSGGSGGTGDTTGTKTLTFTGTVTAPGTYCNEAQIFSYGNAGVTITPTDLKAQACFTALESSLSLVKDFVADDNTTSLGKALTVAANVPAKLRVRVINSGTGGATGVAVTDLLTSGAGATYQVLAVSGGTANTSDGFDATIGDLAAGATSTVLFTVAASADGTYCDTATVTATSGTIGIGSDSACLTVASPSLEITKTNLPVSALPSGTYTSTIIVRNTGSATAKNVVVSDLLGLNPVGNVRVIYVSSSLSGTSGTLAGSVVTASTVDLLAGETLTFTVVSRIPTGAVAGTYCDTATVTSSNTPTKEATACVDVPAFAALQTQLVDLNDPVAIGSDITYFSVLYVEALSNEGVSSNVLTYSFGLVSPTVLGIPGVFNVTSTSIYVDSKPIRDPVTGVVVSDQSNPTAVLQSQGTNYTLTTQLGKQVVVMTPTFVLQPDTAIYVVNIVNVPTGTVAGRLYTTSYIWDSVGLASATHTYQASSSEPTTVLP
jgi:uncharacterized repeat protein (TIGR01451 family)